MKRLKTEEEVMNELSFNGQTISAWARGNGFHPALVRRVIKGEVSGRHGKAHNIAILLGIKEGVICGANGHEHA
jgi:gp16 family phage-associated protein